MKRIISFIMAGITAMAMLGSCGYSPVKSNQTNPDTEIRGIVTAFVDAELQSDYDTARQYITSDELLDMTVLYNNVSGYAQLIYDGVSDEDKNMLLSAMADMTRPQVTYQVISSMFDIDKATVKLVAAMPDVTSVAKEMSDNEKFEIMSEAFGFDVSNSDTFFEAYADRLDMSVGELSEIMDKNDIYVFNDELYAAFRDEFMAYYNLLAGKILAKCDDEAKIQRPFSIYLEKQDDGTWLIARL